MDDTLLAPDLTIPPKSRRALQEATKKGVKITLATGRMFRSVLPYARELEIAVPLIVYNGALIQHPRTREILFHKPIPLECARRVASICHANDLHLNVYIDDVLYIERMRPEAEYYWRISGVKPEVVGGLGKFLADGSHGPTKLLAIAEPGAVQKWVPFFRQEFEGILHITDSKPEFVEMMAEGVSKGRALAFLAQHLGIEPAEVMAIGDGPNDLEMLQFAGVSVAMGNAPESLKAQAGYVTRPNTEEGVAEAIERFAL